MVPVLVLAVMTLVFRGIGAIGVEAFATWQDACRYGLVVMFLVTASAHFTKMKQDLVNMVPGKFRFPKQIVFITGVFEILGAAGMLIPSLRGAAGFCLVVLMVAMFPANVNAAKNKIPLRGKSPTPLWVRLPMQVLFICLTWWATGA